MENTKRFPVFLPQDIHFEILYRLPVKSLVRFRCVCKFWRSLLTSDERFVKSHLHCSAKKKNNFHGNVLFYSKQVEHLESHLADPLLAIQTLENTEVRRNSTCLGDAFTVLGHCDGILCLSKRFDNFAAKDIYLWNPALHQCRTLPASGYLIIFSELGFYYNPLEDDYKVVKMAGGEPKVEIFSLRKNFWKTIDFDVPQHCRGQKDHTPVEFNGILHWYICESDRGRILHWVTKLDTASETFENILFPEGIFPDGVPIFKLFNGSLSLAFWVPDKGYEVWVMKESVFSKSSTIFFMGYPYSILHPIIKGISSNGEILTEYDFKVALYRLDGKTMKIIKSFRLRPGLRHYNLVDYVESFVSVMPSNSSSADDCSPRGHKKQCVFFSPFGFKGSIFSSLNVRFPI